jgi:Flp pilus assembly protein TadD
MVSKRIIPAAGCTSSYWTAAARAGKKNRAMVQLNEALNQVARQVTAGKYADAIGMCRQLLLSHPSDPRIHYALAIALNLAGQPLESIAAFRRAIAIKPDFFEAHTNLGNVLSSQGRFAEAMEYFSEAARLQPQMAEMHVNLSNVFRDSWMLGEAIAAAEKAISLKPNMPEAQLCLGAAVACLGQFDRAKEAYRRAIAVRPDYSVAHMNLGLVELVTGNFRDGWNEYERRRQCFNAVPPRSFTQPAWTGQPIDGKTILIFPEQGFGDAIFFIRYVPMVAAKGAKVILECQPALAPLFGRVPGIERLIVAGESLPPFDFQCALPSLPGAFRTDLSTIPATIPYLSADGEAVERWRRRIGPSENLRQIGIAWAGNAANRNDRNRSISLEKWKPILDAGGSRFHSLQIAPPLAGLGVSDWSAHLTDFAETAALIANLDLVISVDTAAAHLAAAMGKTVWLMIPFPPDWRWMLDRTDSPWYSTVRLFRQKRAGDWEPVLGEVAKSLGP